MCLTQSMDNKRNPKPFTLNARRTDSGYIAYKRLEARQITMSKVDERGKLHKYNYRKRYTDQHEASTSWQNLHLTLAVKLLLKTI
jgi:hypothetical protein